MYVLISYDVKTSEPGGPARLRKVAKICENCGQRVQFSVFECLVEPAHWVSIKHQLEEVIDPEQDSLRYYYLGKNWRKRVEHVGAKEGYDPEGPLIV